MILDLLNLNESDDALSEFDCSKERVGVEGTAIIIAITWQPIEACMQRPLY